MRLGKILCRTKNYLKLSCNFFTKYVTTQTSEEKANKLWCISPKFRLPNNHSNSTTTQYSNTVVSVVAVFKAHGLHSLTLCRPYIRPILWPVFHEEDGGTLPCRNSTHPLCRYFHPVSSTHLRYTVLFQFYILQALSNM